MHVKHLSTDVFKFSHLLENVNKNVELSETVQKNTNQQLILTIPVHYMGQAMLEIFIIQPSFFDDHNGWIKSETCVF